MVFPDVKCPGDHTEGVQHVQGCGGIVPSPGTSNNDEDCVVSGRHGGASVTVYGYFESW